MAKSKANVAPGLIGKRVQFMECPNPSLSLKWSEVTGSYVEDGRLMLVLLFDDGTITTTCAEYVTAYGQKKEKP